MWHALQSDNSPPGYSLIHNSPAEDFSELSLPRKTCCSPPRLRAREGFHFFKPKNWMPVRSSSLNLDCWINEGTFICCGQAYSFPATSHRPAVPVVTFWSNTNMRSQPHQFSSRQSITQIKYEDALHCQRFALREEMQLQVIINSQIITTCKSLMRRRGNWLL